MGSIFEQVINRLFDIGVIISRLHKKTPTDPAMLFVINHGFA
jgi:hypothetical protein